jgi:hypothetical protein
MTRPIDGKIVGDMFAPRSTWAALNAARGAEEARAFALLVEAERIMLATQHRGVAYDISVAAEALQSVCTDEADDLIASQGLKNWQRARAGEQLP